MENYEGMARNCYASLMKDYGLRFAAFDNDEFFLVGNRFAIYVFVDRRDRRSDAWYVLLNNEGDILTYTLMYIQKDRYEQKDYALYGDPNSVDERIKSDMVVNASGLRNRCQDILSGDTNWLTNYPGQGTHSRHIARFLAPYFQQQGYYVKSTEE